MKPMQRPGDGILRMLWTRLKEHPLARLGPGLITGVADDDPSGIATYSQAGAQFGLNMLWTMPLAYPLMSAIQSMCALIGRVTGLGRHLMTTCFVMLTLVLQLWVPYRRYVQVLKWLTLSLLAYAAVLFTV